METDGTTVAEKLPLKALCYKMAPSSGQLSQ